MPKKPNSTDNLVLTILGCGTSAGVPFIECKCKVCTSKNPKNKRLRASVWVKSSTTSVIIDTSTDLRQQALREKISRVDGVLYTHPHSDHISGIDELRSYNYIQKSRIPLYGHAWTGRELRQRYSYIFDPKSYEGGGIPLLDFHEITPDTDRVQVGDITFNPLWLKHGSKDCLGYRFENSAYVTDVSEIPSEAMSNLKNLSVLVLDCVRIAPHDTHLNLNRALEVISELKPKSTFLTHTNHDFDYKKWTTKLPKGVGLAFDGQKIKIVRRNT